MSVSRFWSAGPSSLSMRRARLRQESLPIPMAPTILGTSSQATIRSERLRRRAGPRCCRLVV